MRCSTRGCRARRLLVAGPIAIASFAAAAFAQEPPAAQDVYASALQSFDPDLLRKAEERGLYDRKRFPVDRRINPFFIRGDFDGDGAMDLAFWVQDAETRQRGVAIVHSTLDRVFIFGAGRARPAPAAQTATAIDVDAWHLLPAGHTEPHPYTSVPEAGVIAERPFSFARETLEFAHLGKSAFAFYWADGKYWEIWTAD